MTSNTEHVLKEALELPPIERASLIDGLIASLDQPDKEIDDLWGAVVEERVAKYRKGETKTYSLGEVLAKCQSRGCWIDRLTSGRPPA